MKLGINKVKKTVFLQLNKMSADKKDNNENIVMSISFNQYIMLIDISFLNSNVSF